ncbi:type 1 glutamine amidotransferase domain-containing protein [Bacillus sp. MRMR6]|uniref:type 1 glutamine amidotransferase domain-containing protein n=1 Tax=Bacillus sp. MRMR6 TaxID=1928617 RepID=UPI000951C799|nr:type 1 glutamine amidotransferase domain-containing protein [Bacillus sp. MRMR6]OLS35403.1 protease [Bacillus sp. MRMR6]
MAKVAFLVASDFEDSELKNPYEAIKEAGHEAVIVGTEKGILCEGKQKTVTYTTELAASEANAADFDAVVIPGGSAPEELRVNEGVVSFVKDLNQNSKVVAGICHGPQVMISADILAGKTLTCYIGIRDDVMNSGAHYIDEEVVVSQNIITSRTPKDEPAFIRELLAKLQ